MYVITGATGNIGSKIADSLLEQGKRVRVIGRDAGRLQSFVNRGAEAAVGSTQDAGFLRGAFEGAQAVFAMIPPDLHAQDLAQQQDTIGSAIASALAAANVKFVVNLSSIGAEHPSGTGPIAGMHRQEKRLNGLEGIRTLHLRPTYFMENFLHSIPMIQHMGIVGTAIRRDIPMHMIATRDVAQAAAKALLALDFPEQSEMLLLGPRDYTMAEATGILGKAIGKPELPYVEFSYEDAEKGLVGAGISPSVARAFVEMHGAMNERKIMGRSRTPENTTPTTMEEFAASFAAAFSR